MTLKRRPWASKIDQRNLADHDGKIKELSLKVRLLRDEFVKGNGLQTYVTTGRVEWTTMRAEKTPTTNAMKMMTRSHAVLIGEPNAEPAARPRHERVMKNFVGRV